MRVRVLGAGAAVLAACMSQSLVLRLSLSGVRTAFISHVARGAGSAAHAIAMQELCRGAAGMQWALVRGSARVAVAT